jgi:dynein heavy chain 1
MQACDGEIKQTNYLRSLMTQYLNKGAVTPHWQAYKIPKGLSVSYWIADFNLRILQLQRVADLANSGGSLQTFDIWIGGLFVPEAFITATRQAVAQAHSWPLEQLQLTLDVQASENDKPSLDDQSFCLTNMRMDGATTLGRSVSFTTAPFTMLPLTILRWVNATEEGDPNVGIQLPVYLNATRTDVIFTCFLERPADVTDSTVYSRGVALMCSTLNGDV